MPAITKIALHMRFCYTDSIQLGRDCTTSIIQLPTTPNGASGYPLLPVYQIPCASSATKR